MVPIILITLKIKHVEPLSIIYTKYTTKHKLIFGYYTKSIFLI